MSSEGVWPHSPDLLKVVILDEPTRGIDAAARGDNTLFCRSSVARCFPILLFF